MENVSLARWESRFWAWLIDILLIGALCLVGWLAMPCSKLRLFNRVSNTIVIKTKYEEPEGVAYIKEKE